MITQEDIDAFTPMSEEECLKEFILTFKASLDVRLWYKLIKEEYAELQAETFGTVEHLKEVADLMYVLKGFDVVTPYFLNEIVSDHELDEMDTFIEEANDLVSTAEEYYSSSTVYDAFLYVHDSNMSKLDDDGNPIFREDGKIMKGPNYRAPDLSYLINRKNTK